MAGKKKKQDESFGEEQEQGSNKKLIILIVVGAIVLLAGGLGVGWFLFGSDGGGEDKQSQEVVEEAPKPAIYYPLEPAFIVNLPPGGKLKMLQVEVQVMARDQEVIDFIKANDPMVRHNLLALFGSVESAKLASRAGKEQLQADVLDRINKIVAEQDGPGEVEAVYFTAFVTQ